MRAQLPTMGEGAGDQITILIYQERVLALNMKYGALEQLALINVTSSALNKTSVLQLINNTAEPASNILATSRMCARSRREETSRLLHSLEGTLTTAINRSLIRNVERSSSNLLLGLLQELLTMDEVAAQVEASANPAELEIIIAACEAAAAGMKRRRALLHNNSSQPPAPSATANSSANPPASTDAGPPMAPRVALGLPSRSEDETSALAAVAADQASGQCTFYFVNADYIRSLPSDSVLPSYQMLCTVEGALTARSLNASKAFRAAYTGEYIAVSHRWEMPMAPDPTGAQLRALRDHLQTHRQVRWVWVDFHVRLAACAPPAWLPSPITVHPCTKLPRTARLTSFACCSACPRARIGRPQIVCASDGCSNLSICSTWAAPFSF